MRWNLKGDPTPLKKAHPDLYERFKEFEKEKFEGSLTFEKVIRYIAFCYHQNSPLVKRKMDVGNRKDMALVEAGFEQGSIWPADVREIITNNNDVVIMMILQFLKFERSMRYSNLIMLYERYWILSANTISGSSKAKGDSKELYELLDKIESEEDKVFGDDDIGDSVSATLILEKRNYLITPEENAKNIRDKRKRE